MIAPLGQREAGFGMKKLLVALVLVLTLVGFAAKYKIGVAIPAADHGWTGGMVWWAQYAIKQYQNDPDVEFYLVTARNRANRSPKSKPCSHAASTHWSSTRTSLPHSHPSVFRPSDRVCTRS